MNPILSVIIPTYHRAESLDRCLSALSKQNTSKFSFEVLVVNDGGHSVQSICTAWFDKLAISVVNISHAGPAAARNAGVNQALGEYLVFTDDDCIPCDCWLETIYTNFNEYPHCILGGRVNNYLNENIFATTSQIVLDMVCAQYNQDVLNARFFTTNNIAIPRSDFLALGGFDAEHFPMASEDRNFCARWLASGRRMVYIQNMIVYHAHDLNLYSFLRQYFKYGQGAFWFYKMKAYYPVDTVKVQQGLYRYFLYRLESNLKDFSWQEKLKIVILLFFWQIANSVGYVLEYFKSLKLRF